MKSLMLLLALGLASSDKLDRTYLPPPGSKIAGGSDGAIQVPLEYPKETYSTTIRPLTPGQKEDGFISVSDRQPTIGVGPPNIPPGSPDLVPVTPGPKTLFGNLRNKAPAPTTTYAFTQTTAFPIPEGFETTVNALGPTGFASDLSQDIQNGVYTPAGQSQGYPQPSGPAYVQPSTQIVQRPGLPIPGAVLRPGYQTPAQTFIDYPGYSQPSIIQNLPGQTSSTTVSPISGSSPELTQPPFGQGYTQHLGVQPPRQFGQQVLSPSLAPQNVPQNYPPGSAPAFYGNAVQRPVSPELITPQQIGGRRPQNLEEQTLQNTIQPDVQYVTDNRGNIVPISSFQELGGQRPLFGGQPIPTQPGTSPQFINNVQMIPGSNLPQQLGDQQSVFRGQQAPPSPTSTTVPQSGSYPQYSNVLPGSNISQPGVKTLNQQQGPYTGVPQYQAALNNQGSVIPGSPTPQVIGPQPQFINQPGFTPVTASPQGIPSSYQPGSSQQGVFQPTVDRLGVNQPGVIHTGYTPSSSSQPGSAQSPATGIIPQTTIYPSQPSRIIPGKPGTSPIPIASAGYNQQYSSTTPGTIPGSFPSTTISLRITSSTPYPLPGQTDIDSGKTRRPERPQAEFDRNAEILNYKNVLTPDGEFEYSFDTSNGIHADENGTSIDGVKAEGSYSYIGDDGNLYSVVYSADENGFRPQGAHLPTPPPIPDAIQRVIEQAAKDKEAGISDDGHYDDNKYGHKKYQSPNRLRLQQQDKFINNGADIPNDYDEVIRPGQIKPGQVKSGQVRPGQIKGSQVISDRVRPGQFKSGTKEEGTQTQREPNAGVGVDEYDEYVLNNEEHDNVDVKIPGNRIPSKRPLDKQPNKYSYDKDRRIISDKKPSSTGLRGDSEDRYLPGVTEASSRYPTTPGRKPINRPGLSKDRYDTEGEDINENEDLIKDYEKDSRLPSIGSQKKYYDQDEHKLPEKFDQQYTITGRPAGFKRPVTTTMRYDDEEELTSQPEAHQVKHGQRPLKPSPGSLYNESENNDAYFETDEPESNNASGKPQGSRRPVSDSSKYYPGQTLKPGRPSSPQYEATDDNEGEIYDQVGVRRPYDQRKGSMKSKFPTQPGNKITGYQYLPPQHKFQEIDGTRMDQASEVNVGTKRPVSKGYSDDKTTIPDIYGDEGITASKKPVQKPEPVTTYPDTYASSESPHYVENDFEGRTSQPQYGDKYSDDESIQQGSRPGYGGSRYSKPSGQQRPGQVYSEESVEGSKIPSYIQSSTTPMPSRGRDPTNDRPQYKQTYDESFPTSTAIPGMRIPGRPGRPGYGETISPGSSTVTPGEVDISRPSSQLPYQYGDRTTPGASRVSSNRPGQRIYEYSTTPKTKVYRPGSFTSGPDRIYKDQTRPGYAPENYGASRRPTTSYPDTIAPGTDTVGPGIKIPSKIGVQNVPSTTYRPNYTIIDEITGKPITVDTFGKPVSTTYRPEYTENQPNSVFDKFRPIQGPDTSGVQTTAQVFRPNEPRLEQTSPPNFAFQRPGTQVSSSTQRVIGEDFSGPKQPQRFDPKTGYHY